MKIIFAMNNANNDEITIKKFEDLVIQSFNDEIPGFRLDNAFHCTNKSALLRITDEASADLLILNEELPGEESMIDVLKTVRVNQPDMQIVMLLTSERKPGNKFVSELVDLGIYDWLYPKWKPISIVKSFTDPKRKSDVEDYLMVSESSENTSFRYFDTELDLNQSSVQEKRVAPKYTSVLPMGVAEGLSKISYIESIPSVEEVSVSLKGNEKTKTSNDDDMKKEPVNKPVAQPADVKPINIEKVGDKVDIEGLQGLRRTNVIERRSAHYISTDKPVDEKEEFAKKEKSPKQEVKFEKPKEEKFAKESVKKEVKEKVKVATKVEDNKKQEIIISKDINKVLVLHVLPLTSYIAPTIYTTFKKSNKDCVYIDLTNGNNPLNEYLVNRKFNVKKSLIKNSINLIKETPCAVIEMVAGNGMEKVLPLVDRIIIVTPQDKYALNLFASRYKDMIKKPYDIFVEKAIYGACTVADLLEILPESKSVTLLRVVKDETNGKVLSGKDYKDLINEKDYSDFQGSISQMTHFIKSIGGDDSE